MKASSYRPFGYAAALDWCCDHSRLEEDSMPQPNEKEECPDSNASAATASTQDDLSTEPLFAAAMEQEAVPFGASSCTDSSSSQEEEEASSTTHSSQEEKSTEKHSQEATETLKAERSRGPIDLDTLSEASEEGEEVDAVAPVISQDTTLGSLDTMNSANENDDDAWRVAACPTDRLEAAQVTEDPLLFLLVAQGPERARDPTQLDALLQDILQADDEITLASSTATFPILPLPEAGGLMDALAAGPVDVDDFIPEDSYWALDTHDFVLDEVELSRQLSGYHEGCEPPRIDTILPPPRIHRQRTAATAATAELVRRAQGLPQPHYTERPRPALRSTTHPARRPAAPRSRVHATTPRSGAPSVTPSIRRSGVHSVTPRSGTPATTTPSVRSGAPSATARLRSGAPSTTPSVRTGVHSTTPLIRSAMTPERLRSGALRSPLRATLRKDRRFPASAAEV